jgi:NADH:ubiquinone oxidoreductase subunit F (NADH-binding)
VVDERVEEFLRWLQNERGLKKKSARDVVSRLRRAAWEGWVEGAWEEGDLDELFLRLKKSPSFCALNPSVKSQVKVALRYWKEFTESKGR